MDSCKMKLQHSGIDTYCCVAYIPILLFQSRVICDVLRVADSLGHAVGLVLRHLPGLSVHPLVFLEKVVKCISDVVNHFKCSGLW